jgi:Zn-dependent protease with chaperone function
MLAPPIDLRVTFGTASLSVFVIGLTWWASAVFSTYRLWKARSRVLGVEEAPELFEMVRHESIRIGLPPNLQPKIYVTDWNTRVRAGVLGGFTPKLLVSGAFVVLADRQREQAQIILRHELAHISAGDTKLFVYVLLLLGGLIAILFSGGILGFALATSVFQAMFLVYLLRRREYLADAFSLNWTAPRSAYLDALLPANKEHERRFRPEGNAGLFHPDTQARVRAITDDCPVLRTSIGFLVFYVLVICLSGLQILVLWDSNKFGIAVISFVAAAILPLFGIVVEFSKGFGRKYPLPLPDLVASAEASSPQETTSSPTPTPLFAQVMGVATANVKWAVALLFVASYAFTDVAILGLLDRGMSIWVLLCTLSLATIWGCSMLVAFRCVKSVILAPFAGSVLYAVAVLVIRLCVYQFDFDLRFLAAFVQSFVGMLSLGWSVQRIHPLWVGLVVGRLGEGLLYLLFSMLGGENALPIAHKVEIAITTGLAFSLLFVLGLRCLQGQNQTPP